MPPAARMGDTTAHGGLITIGLPTVLIEGLPAAAVGDLHTCPIADPVPHVGGPILGPGVPTVLIGGRPAAVLGDQLTCVGVVDAVILGAPTVLIGG
jgi:uncharacterized Zn-binding protein involved in type VI secretion